MATNISQALKEAKRRFVVGKNGVTAVYIGRKWKGGKSTGATAIVVAVEKKLPLAELPEAQRVPQSLAGIRTDVVQAKFEALAIPAQVAATELTKKLRPCPGGYSVGHPDITAGTLGAWVRRNEQQVILTNNHVAANSNKASIGDEILQPGPYDGGQRLVDRIAKLTDFVIINFGQKPKKKLARYLWKAWLAVPNAIAKAVKCPYRARMARAAVDQTKNYVDAAVAQAIDPAFVEERVEYIGPVRGIRDLVLGDRVQKTGRTTGLTSGYVDGVGATIQVSYGEDGTAIFEDQLIIRSDAGEFSAGGDSGSAILTEDCYLAGLLFAGGEGMTIANRISNVVSLLGIQVPAEYL